LRKGQRGSCKDTCARDREAAFGWNHGQPVGMPAACPSVTPSGTCFPRRFPTLRSAGRA
jgi:hypothetical protein